MSESDEEIVAGVSLRDFDLLLELEASDLNTIIATDIDELEQMRVSLKKIIYTYIAA